MHRAIKSALRPGALDPRPLIGVRLSAIPVGCARILNDFPVWRCGVDLFAIDGVEGTHDAVSAASVISGNGNPLPETSNQ